MCPSSGENCCIYATLVFATLQLRANKREYLLIYYGLYAITLPMCTVSIAGKAMYMCCSTVWDAIRVPIANFQKSSILFLKFAVTSHL
jgi:hypothetical protein